MLVNSWNTTSSDRIRFNRVWGQSSFRRVSETRARAPSPLTESYSWIDNLPMVRLSGRAQCRPLIGQSPVNTRLWLADVLAPMFPDQSCSHASDHGLQRSQSSRLLTLLPAAGRLGHNMLTGFLIAPVRIYSHLHFPLNTQTLPYPDALVNHRLKLSRILLSIFS